MANKKIAELISKGLREGMTHPGRNGGESRPLVPGWFRTAGMPKEMAQLVNETADLLGEAIVALIETEGESEIVQRGSSAELRAELAVAESTAPQRVVTLHCHCDTAGTDPLAVLTVTNKPRVVIDGKQLLEGLASRESECPHHYKGAAS